MIERGPAKYFHGREKELKIFNQLLDTMVDSPIGSSFLIQGPPGVGKSALLEEYTQQARKKQWEVIELSNECLSDSKELFAKLTKKSKPKEFKKSFGLDLKVFKMNLEKIPITETNALNEALIGSKPTLLWLDETQTLNAFLDHTDKTKITSFLTRYHNLKTKKGFILLLGGLSTTKEILRTFGISRFNTGCVRYLQRLEPDAEQSIIHDWLTKEIKTPSDTTTWIQEIIKRTDRWPRHIQSYCNALCEFLEVGETLTNQRLKQVLKHGDDLKHTYYQQRCDGFHRKTRAFIASTVKQLPEQFDMEELIALFSKTLSSEKASDLYQTVLSKGIVHMDQQGICSVPIPSLRSFLIEEYG